MVCHWVSFRQVLACLLADSPRAYHGQDDQQAAPHAQQRRAHRQVEAPPARRADLVNELRLAQGDATTFDPQQAFAMPGFDRIFMSYTLSMIPDWQGAIVQAMNNLTPRGELHIVDFGQQERLPGWFRALLFKWLDLFHVSPRADMKSVLEDIAARCNASLEFTPLYRGYAWSAVIRLE